MKDVIVGCETTEVGSVLSWKPRASFDLERSPVVSLSSLA